MDISGREAFVFKRSRQALHATALALFTCGLSRAEPLSSANFRIPTQNYNSAGVYEAASANFRAFVDAGDVIGPIASTNFQSLTGHTYTLFDSTGASVLPAPSQPNAPAGTALGVSSISWTWTSAANATSYNVLLATGTLLANVATTSYTLAGLSTNTAYGVAIQAINASGSSALSAAATAYTLSDSPGAVLSGSVGSTTIALTWTANTNPGGTPYEVSFSSGAGFTTQSTTTLLSSTAAGLSPSTLYSFRVRALNGDSIGTVYVTTTATTAPPPPGIPGTPIGTVSGASSITWTWTAATNASIYGVYYTTSPATSAGTTTALSLPQTGLSPNTTSSVYVQGSNASGAGPASSSGTSVYTHANPPTGLAATLVESTSATLSWSLNSNPSGTLAELERSTDNVNFSNVYTGGATATADYGLIGCTPYYYRARNRNGSSITTAYTATASFTTAASTPAAPSSLLADPVAGNKILLTWTASPTEGVTQYKLYEVGTGTGNYGAALAVFTSTEAAYTTGALTSGAHGFALRAVHRCGVEESSGTYASATAIAAVSAVRASIKSPNTGKRIRGNSVTVIAELTAGNPADVSSMTFQIKQSSASSWNNMVAANLNHPNPDLLSPYFIQWDADSFGTANGFGAYDIRAVAMNVAGSSDTAPSSIRITLVDKNIALSAGNDYDIKEDAASKVQVVNNAVANTLACAGTGLTDPVVKIVVPAGALNNSTVTATVIANPAITTSAPTGFSLVGSALQIDLSNGQSSLSIPATLTLSYPESADARASNMQIQSLDPVTGAWSAIGAATIDRTLRTVTASTPHFSIFAIIAGSGAQSNLSRVRVYPVPFKPNGSDPNEGRPYVSGDLTSGIIFDRLPATVNLKIYTLSGRLVAQFDTAAGTGTIQWDARNEAGRDVASGGYFAVISSPGSQSVIKRLLIVR